LNTAQDDLSGSIVKARRLSSRPRSLLDRDSTIIVDHGDISSVDRVEFIERSPEAIAKFNRASVSVAGVTNRAEVARGLSGIDDATLGAALSKRLAKDGRQVF
jgi:histidinol phosphatase-like enzyme